MATADSGSGPVSLFPVNNKLQARMNLLKEVIASQKLEVRRIREEMIRLIEKKENEITKELDSIWDEANARIGKKKEEIQKKIEKIEKRIDEMKKSYDEMKMLLEQMNQTLPPHSLPHVSEAVESAKRELDISIPYLNLSWRVDALRESINKMCCVEHVFREETTPFQLTWSKSEKGNGERQLAHPCGIAINSINDNIYVTERYKHRVQIFSKEGEWIRSLKNEKIIDSVHILAHTNNLIYRVYHKCCRVVELSK